MNGGQMEEQKSYHGIRKARRLQVQNGHTLITNFIFTHNFAINMFYIRWYLL